MDVAYDWIKRARKAKRQPEERVRCLREAERCATQASEWLDVAEAWGDVVAHASDDGEGRDGLRRCIAAAAARDPVKDTFGPAASLLVRALGDREAARDALAQRRAYLDGAAETRAFEWTGLAGYYVRALDDRDCARGCLAAGLARLVPAEPRDLCSIARAYDELGDREPASTLLDQAEALCEAGHDDWWDVANTCAAFGDRARAWQVLEAGVAQADSVARCERIAKAIACHARDDEPERKRFVLVPLAKAEQLATTCNDWLTIGDAYFEHRAPADAIRRCLEHALATDDGTAKTRIAHGYRHWLGEPARADELAPRGVTPKDAMPQRRQLFGWQAAPAALLDWLRPQLTVKQLRGMATADWGTDQEKHLAALVDIQATGLVPRPLTWHPREVLELTRWREGADTDHVARAFACTVLLIDACGPEYRDGHEQTLAVLVESCVVLGGEAIDAGIGLCVAVAECFDDRNEGVFALCALLLAAAARDPRDARLPALCAKLVADEHHAQRYGYQVGEYGWLLGLTNFASRHPLYKRLAHELLGVPAAQDPSLAHLGDIAARLR